MKPTAHEKTNQVHPVRCDIPKDNHPLVDPIHVSSKFYFDKYEDLENLIAGSRRGYLYSRVLNPTVRSLEKSLARLQGTDDGICLSSGIAAISTLFFTTLCAGDHVIYFIESYKPTRYLIQKFLAKWNISSTILSIHDHAGIENTVKETPTKLIIFESPTNPMLHVADLKKITTLASKHGVLTALDNTFAGFHNHSEYPVDFYVHSLTKFAGGHSDALGGVILGRQKLIDQIRWPAAEIGSSLDAQAAYQILKGLKTYSLRYEAGCRNALEVAKFLESHSSVEKVKYPGLTSHPQHKLAQVQLKDFGTVVSADLRLPLTPKKFIDALQLIRPSPSLGTVESLVAPVELFYGGLLTNEQKEKSEITPQSIRIAVGIENIEDILFDLKKALKC